MPSSGCPGRAGGAGGGDDVVDGERDVLRLRNAGRPLAAAQQRDGEGQPDAPGGVGEGAAAHQAERGRELAGAAGLQPEDRAVEQGRLVEVVEGLGEPDVVRRR